MFLPQGEDPDSMVRQEGKDAFLKRIHNEALTLDDYFFKQLANEVDITDTGWVRASCKNGRTVLSATARRQL